MPNSLSVISSKLPPSNGYVVDSEGIKMDGPRQGLGYTQVAAAHQCL